METLKYETSKYEMLKKVCEDLKNDRIQPDIALKKISRELNIIINTQAWTVIECDSYTENEEIMKGWDHEKNQPIYETNLKKTAWMDIHLPFAYVEIIVQEHNEEPAHVKTRIHRDIPEQRIECTCS